MNGGYRGDPGEVGQTLPEFRDICSSVEIAIDDVIESDDIEIVYKMLHKFYDSYFRLCRLLLKENLEGEFDLELKRKIRIINNISTDLFNRYNVLFAKRAHDDSIRLTRVLMLLTCILAWVTVVSVPSMIEYNGFSIRWDSPVICLVIAYFYFKWYRPYENRNIDIDTDPMVWGNA
jgi:hypothetical protein